ncbi:hypothetical protein HXX01_02505 [Candidatus Nomurabacteria bacterium]|nr:hypothetical protein [Candidatus Nomurabacteria bacterium]
MRQLSFLIIVLISAITPVLHSQNLIAVQNNNAPSFYTQLDSAIVYAQNGDTIYLPGGTYLLSAQIAKCLHIIGVGINIDSSLATGITRINGPLSLQNEFEASNGSISGVYLVGEIYSGNRISNYSVRRCRIGGLRMASNVTNANSSWIFSENIIQGIMEISAPGASNCLFSNNIIDAISINTDNGFVSSIFKNNIFLLEGYCGWGFCNLPISASGSNFENNIFLSSQITTQHIYNSSMNNNLFVENFAISGEQIWGSNNIVDQPQTSIFMNQSGNNFDFHHDYHLQSSSPGKNAGKDGTDIGIYGGAFPWKAGSVPPNPHTQFENVSGVDEAGNIHVNIKVAAQDR